MFRGLPRRVIPVAVVLALAACQVTPTRAPVSGVQLQSYQAREFEADKRVAFAAAMSVFQDLGFIIDDGDFDTGLITASGPTTKPRQTPGIFDILLGTDVPVHTTRRRATAFVETMPSARVRIRLNFVDASTIGVNNAISSVPIEDAEIYRDTFARIDQAIFVRSATR